MSKLRWSGLGFAVGVATGVLVVRAMRSDPPAPSSRAIPGETAPAAPAMPQAAAAPPPPMAIPPPSLAPAGESPAQAVLRLQAENAQLRGELNRVQHAIATEEAVSKAEHGEPIPAPPNLAPRFSQQSLFDATQQALKEAGFTNAQVTSVDCTEYPCIVYGDGMGDREDFDKLQKTDALAEYKDDSRNAMGWGTGRDGGNSYRFGLAVYPKESDPTQRDAIMKRLRYRAQQMMEGGP